MDVSLDLRNIDEVGVPNVKSPAIDEEPSISIIYLSKGW